MEKLVVLGAGLGGLPCALELKHRFGDAHEITLINNARTFQFVPSNPWVAVGWRRRDQVEVDLEQVTRKKGIRFEAQAAKEVLPAQNQVLLNDGSKVDYDYLVITTGPTLAFDEIEGLGPDGFTQSICTLEHAEKAQAAYTVFLDNPGPIVVGAVQGASCFGPAYEFALILDRDLSRRRLRDKVPITFVTSEPYVGHLGLGGVGDSKGILESVLRKRDIKWITNAKVDRVEAGQMHVTEHDDAGQPKQETVLPFNFSMMLPAFKGVAAVAAAAELCNPRGFVQIDEFQRNPKYPNVYSAGVCVAIPPVEKTPVPTGAPKTGYMIESMVTAIVENIESAIESREPTARATWNAICLADMGNRGIAFVALPQIPPRNVTWTKAGRWVHWAKVAFEFYFMRKMRQGKSEAGYERALLRWFGISRLLPGGRKG
ncbi:MAG: FAD/NAD(P)-binding oxidoreductase [Gammaproteobacteria bacterium]